MEGSTQQNSEKMYWAKHKPNALFTITPTPDKDFFVWWCTLLTTFVKLTPREISVIACYLKHRHELSKYISSSEVLDSQLMSNDVRDQVVEECGITLQNFYVIHSNLQKKGIITETGINSRLIPRFRKDDNDTFQLLIAFNGLQLT